jgi:carboxypeptidase A4
MLVDSGLHAREWIAVMVGTCVADRLVRGYDHDPRVRRLVDATELVVVPVANPDGYEHSWRRDRYWRKNRRDGHGVDLNRNFGVAWGGEGSSGKTASQVYRGEAPFSEPEAEALRALIEREGLAAHVDFHSYGQLLLHPWSHTRERSRDHRRLAGLADSMVKAIAAAHGERYRPMSGESLYPASGTLMDWAYGTHGVASFVIELRPRGGTGFVLPPDQIVPTCDEGLAAVLALGEGAADVR